MSSSSLSALAILKVQTPLQIYIEHLLKAFMKLFEIFYNAVQKEIEFIEYPET